MERHKTTEPRGIPSLSGEGRVAWIAGGASGIGRAAAQVFALAGYRVLVVDRDQSGDAVVRGIDSQQAEVRFVRTDVVESDQVREAVEKALDLWGRLDFVLNCAGILGPMSLIESLESSAADKVLDVNLKGALHVCREAVRTMRKTGGGAIVNVTSISAWNGSPGFPVYSATKAGLIGLTRSIARRTGRYNIRVNCLSPGSISGTALERDSGSSQDEHGGHLERQAALMRRIPLGRAGRPEDVAYFALFLASPLARHINGSELIIDGGERLGYL